jgi:hypothetical protein
MKTIPLGLALMLAAAPALAGGTGGRGGADTVPIGSESAWFVGERPVKYCLERHPAFPFGESELLDTVKKAIETWRKYALDKQAWSARFSDPAGLFSISYEHQGPCDGKENLKFAFGTSDAETAAARSRYVDPSAFPELLKRGEGGSHGKGYIWVAPSGSAPREAPVDWTRPNALFGILLHEIGHVFGCSHVDDTIMTENLPILITRWTTGFPDRAYHLASIDGNRELTYCSDCEREYVGNVSSFTVHRPEAVSAREDAARVFKTFVGHDPVGQVVARLRVQGMSRFVYILKDEGTGSEHEFPIESSGTQFSSYGIPAAAFQVGSTSSPQHPRKSSGAWHTQGVMYGRIEVGGKMRMALIELNTPDRSFVAGEFAYSKAGPIAVNYVTEEGNLYPIFMASFPEYTGIVSRPLR